MKTRLILVMQYPSPLRYQEWWWDTFKSNFKPYFEEVLVLGEQCIKEELNKQGDADFAPMEQSILFEQAQIKEYMQLSLKKGDVLLLTDLSYPGLFANVLFHKRPERCVAIVHATAKNRYDIFQKDRRSKYNQEKALSLLFDKIVVASEYHKQKLGWKNIVVQSLPFPPFNSRSVWKTRSIVSVARKTPQKRTMSFERRFEKETGISIQNGITAKDWKSYYHQLSMFKILLITAKEETFGYQVIDGLKNGCIVIAPNAYSYPELLEGRFLFDDYEGMKKLLLRYLKQEDVETIRCAYSSYKFYPEIARLCQ